MFRRISSGDSPVLFDTLILKPSENSTLVADRIGDLVGRSGLAARGVAQVVRGGPEAGPVLHLKCLVSMASADRRG